LGAKHGNKIRGGVGVAGKIGSMVAGGLAGMDALANASQSGSLSGAIQAPVSAYTTQQTLDPSGQMLGAEKQLTDIRGQNVEQQRVVASDERALDREKEQQRLANDPKAKPRGYVEPVPLPNVTSTGSVPAGYNAGGMPPPPPGMGGSDGSGPPAAPTTAPVPVPVTTPVSAAPIPVVPAPSQREGWYDTENPQAVLGEQDKVGVVAAGGVRPTGVDPSLPWPPAPPMQQPPPPVQVSTAVPPNMGMPPPMPPGLGQQQPVQTTPAVSKVNPEGMLANSPASAVAQEETTPAPLLKPNMLPLPASPSSGQPVINPLNPEAEVGVRQALGGREPPMTTQQAIGVLTPTTQESQQGATPIEVSPTWGKPEQPLPIGMEQPIKAFVNTFFDTYSDILKHESPETVAYYASLFFLKR